MTPLRVIVTQPWAARQGGAETMLWTWLRRLDRDRIDPKIVFFDPGPFEQEVAELGFETAVIPVGRLRQPVRAARAIAELARQLRAWRPDLVLNWSPKAHLYGTGSTLLAGIPHKTLWWQHSVPERHWMDRLATLMPARAVGCSSQASATAQSRLRPRRRTFVVWPGIEINGRGETPPADLDIPAGRVVVGIVGRLQPWKGQHHVLHALALLRKRGLDVHGLFVGGSAFGFSEDYPLELEDLIDRLELRNHVTMVGQVPDADPYLRVMDVFVNASSGEPFGIVLPEAMAHSLPIVAVASGGPLEIVEDGTTGLLVERPDGALLADALKNLVADPETRQRMGASGRERCLRLFTADRMVDKLDSELEEIARGN
jgi:glycosyltransferase involved in cell wall biosynthesis